MTSTSLSKGTFAWMALLAVIAVAVVTLVPWPATRQPAAPAPAPDAAASGAPEPLSDYLDFAGRMGERPGAADDAFVIEGLRKLAGALGAVGVENPTLPSDLRIAAEHVVLNADDAETTALVRDHFVAVAAALERHDRERALRPAADAVQPGQPISTQRERVAEFFRRAADALRRARPQAG